MPDTLVDLMVEFGGLVQRYRAEEARKTAATLGLTERDFVILEFVAGKGEATFAEISEYLRLSDMPTPAASTISQTISALYAKHGLVEKRAAPQDQRQPLVSLTDKGRKLVGRALEVRRRVLSDVKTAMKPSREEQKVLETVFRRGLENFRTMLSRDLVT